MDKEITDCDVGILTNTKCRMRTFTNKQNLYNLDSLTNSDILNL